MNRFFICIVTALAISAASLQSQAQPKPEDGWKDRIMSEKIAFLTNKMGLTPEEAQSFWPVYNQVWEERAKARHEVMESYRHLDEAVKAGKPSKELTSLLDRYLDSIDRMNETDRCAADKYRKALPAEKVARLYVAEEQFRRDQIHKLHHNPGKR